LQQSYGERCRPTSLEDHRSVAAYKDLIHTITADNGKEFARISGNSERIGNFLLFL
jgi:IS30 family transposase